MVQEEQEVLEVVLLHGGGYVLVDVVHRRRGWEVKEKARESVLAKLEQGKAEIARRDAERRAAQPNPKWGMER